MRDGDDELAQIQKDRLYLAVVRAMRAALPLA